MAKKKASEISFENNPTRILIANGIVNWMDTDELAQDLTESVNVA